MPRLPYKDRGAHTATDMGMKAANVLYGFRPFKDNALRSKTAEVMSLKNGSELSDFE